MGAAERPLRGQGAVADFARDGGDHRHFQEFGWRQRRQDRRDSRGEHRLARAGRTHHEKMMFAGRRNFQRALGALLALDVAQVELVGLRLMHLR